ncbi:DUF6636 domain-containing protein [Actinomycetes bacterium M1A6_2h]
MFKFAGILAVSALTIVSLAACSSGSDSASTPPPTAAATSTGTVSAPPPAPTEDAPDTQPFTGASFTDIPPAPTRDDVNVDARDFQQGDSYYFTSPSGNAFCAFRSFNAPGTDIGCQVRYSVPGSTGRVCGNVANNTYGVQVLNSGTVEQICTNQGIFVSTEPRVLQYGDIIAVQGDSCRSTEAGIICYSVAGTGFMISRDVNVTF